MKQQAVEATLRRIQSYVVKAAPKKIKLTRKQFKEWDGMSYWQQVQYLEEHPNSIFQQVGVTKKRTRGKSKKTLERENAEKGESNDTENKETGSEENNDDSDSVSENNDSESGNEGGSDSAGDGKTDESGEGTAKDEPSSDGNSSESVPTSDESKTDSPDADAKDGQSKSEDPNAEQGENNNDKGADATSNEGGDSEPQLSTKHREADDATKQSAENNIKELEEEGASAPNSKQREGIAASIEQSADKVAEQLDASDVDDIEEGYDEAKEEVTKKKGMSKRTKNILTVMGMIALAGAAGVGLFYINPILAFGMGQMIGNNLGEIASLLTKDDDDNETNASAGGLQAMIKDVAEYMRVGDLPDDFVEAARLSVGIEGSDEKV